MKSEGVAVFALVLSIIAIIGVFASLGITGMAVGGDRSIKVVLLEGQLKTVSIGGETYKIKFSSMSSSRIKVTVNAESAVIKEGESKTISGIDVKVVDIRTSFFKKKVYAILELSLSPIQCITDTDCPSREGTPYCSEEGDSCREVSHDSCIDSKCVTAGGGELCQVCDEGCEDGVCIEEEGPSETPELPVGTYYGCYEKREASSGWGTTGIYRNNSALVNQVSVYCNNQEDIAVSGGFACNPRTWDQAEPVYASVSASMVGGELLQGWQVICVGGESGAIAIVKCCKKS